MTEILEETARTFDVEALEFKARRGPYAKLLLVTTLLTLVTFGIYRFWGKTRIRKYLWRSVRLLGDPLEYTGTGKELFLGFLIVVAILFPLGLIYGAIDFLIPPTEMTLRFVVEGIYYIVIFALLQIGFYRMWRYRMSRTAWRGIRFGLDGSSWTFLKLATGWTLLCVITLGIAYPWMKIDLWRYQMAHTRIGSERFAFQGKGRQLLVPWLFVNVPLLFYVGLLVIGAVTGLEAAQAAKGGGTTEIKAFLNDHLAIIGTFGMLGGLSIVVLPFTYGYYLVRQTRLWISGLTLGQVTFKSALPYWRLFGYALMTGVILVVLFAPFPSLFLMTGRTGHGMGAEVVLAFAGFAILFTLFAPLIWSVIFGFELIKQTITTTAIENADMIETIPQGSATDIKTGEGLADAFDIGAF